MTIILGTTFEPETRTQIMQKIRHALEQKTFLQIVSLNPEIVIAAQSSEEYRKVLNESEIKLIDGAGMILAGKILNVEVGERITGVDLMPSLLEIADEMKLKVLLLGGDNNIADDLSQILKNKYRDAEFRGVHGYLDVEHATDEEEKSVRELLESYKPDLIFVAFGAPAQDIWIDSHKDYLKNTVSMSVGGAFDFLSGKVPRAPRFMQKVGLEWLFRLTVQPWRWRRQTKLIKFILLIFKQKLRF